MKTLLYLDQPFLSNLYKSRMSHPGVDPVWGELDTILHRAVTHDETVICPRTSFQEEESSLDSRLTVGIHRIAVQFSSGLCFLPWQTLLDGQARHALCKFCGQHPGEQDWTEVFTDDPHEPLHGKLTYVSGKAFVVDAHLPRPIEFIEEHRETKRIVVDRLRNTTRLNTGNYQQVLRSQKESFVVTRFLLPAKQVVQAIAEERAPSPIDIENADSAKWLLNEFKALAATGRSFQEFLFSDEMFAAPFLDVFCSLYATLDFHAAARTPRGSDFDDIPILATTIPYCQLVTMDSGMQDICHKARLSDRYAFESYCPKTGDVERLVEKLSRF